MADTDLSQQFDKVSDRAKAAADTVKAANAHAREQLDADVAAAREKANQANDQMKAKASAQREKASSHWQGGPGEVAGTCRQSQSGGEEPERAARRQRSG